MFLPTGPSGSVHVAELIGIFHAISSVLKVAHQHPWAVHSRTTTATIPCDSKSALQTIQNPSNKSGQQIIHAILQASTEIQARGIAPRLQRIPEHMTQRIDWPKTPQDQARHTPSVRCSQGRRCSSMIASTHSGSKSGSLPQKGFTFDELTTHCRQPTPEGCMVVCPGTTHTC